MKRPNRTIRFEGRYDPATLLNSRNCSSVADLKEEVRGLQRELDYVLDAARRRLLVIHWIYGIPMVKKLTRHGNSFALVIDRPILELLNIDIDTPLEVSTDGKKLTVSRAKPSARRKKFEAAQELAHKQALR
jgi:antitoxin MazE